MMSETEAAPSPSDLKNTEESIEDKIDSMDESPRLVTSGQHSGGDVEDDRVSILSVEAGCGGKVCDPRQTPYRFIALVFMCSLGFGSYFCYDTPASLQNQIKEDMNVNTLQFSTLYSLYSWPNVFLCFVGGFLIDKVFGIRIGTLIFSTLVTAGHFVYALGALFNAFWLMQLGRFIFGVGGESLAVAQNTYTVSWFKGKELNTVFGLQLSMARIGSTVNFLVMEPIYDLMDTFADGYTTLGLALLFAGVTCIFSLICAIILAFLDKRRTKILRLDSAETGEKIQLRDILYFPLSFWLISLICVAYYSAIFPFIGLSKVFFMYKYDFSERKANLVSSIVYVISAFMSPIFGYLVDKTGRNIMWVGTAVFFTIISHAILAFSLLNPFIPMGLMGLSYSLLASSLWPMVALILPENQLGTGYGIMQSIQNLGLALISMLSGFTVDNYGYLMLEILNLICLSIGLGSVGVIWVVDAYQDDGYLMTSAKKRPKENPRIKKIEALQKKDREDREGNDGDVELELKGAEFEKKILEEGEDMKSVEGGGVANEEEHAKELATNQEAGKDAMNNLKQEKEDQTGEQGDKESNGISSPAKDEDSKKETEKESNIISSPEDIEDSKPDDSSHQRSKSGSSSDASETGEDDKL